MKTLLQRFHSSYQVQADGCWIWQKSTNKNGYGWFSLTPKTNLQAHRASYKFLVGEIPEGLLVLHKCDVRNCVNPDHLFLGTQKDNIRDMVKKGRQNRSCGWKGKSKFKLSREQVEKIRQSDKSQAKLAKEYGVSQPTISQIINLETWKNTLVGR